MIFVPHLITTWINSINLIKQKITNLLFWLYVHNFCVYMNHTSKDSNLKFVAEMSFHVFLCDIIPSSSSALYRRRCSFVSIDSHLLIQLSSHVYHLTLTHWFSCSSHMGTHSNSQVVHVPHHLSILCYALLWALHSVYLFTLMPSFHGCSCVIIDTYPVRLNVCSSHLAVYASSILQANIPTPKLPWLSVTSSSSLICVILVISRL